MDYIKAPYNKPENSVATEILIAKLAEAGFESFEETENSVLAYIPAKDFNKSLLPDDFGKVKTEIIKDQNWNAVWESNYDPVFIAGKVFIRAPFHKSNKQAQYEIVINPKMAFGTAHHETTALIIEYLLEMEQEIKEKTVLDMGCGTGVLAVLCAMQGAAKVLAVDNDTWSVESSKENVEVNKTPQVEVLHGDASDLKEKEIYDIILANINKNILLNDMNTYVKSLKQKGSILFSGFYQQDLPELKEKANSLGLIFENYKTKNNWTAAKFVK